MTVGEKKTMFKNWDECKEAMTGVKGANCNGYHTEGEAKQAMAVGNKQKT